MLKFLVSVITVLVLVFFAFDYYVRSIKSTNTSSVEFIIADASATGGRDSLFDVGTNLKNEKIVDSKYFFYYYAWRAKLRGQILAGTYIIQPQSSLAEVSQLFTEGRIKEVKQEEISVTFKEGLTLDEMADSLKGSGLPHDDFLALAQSPTEEIRSPYAYIPDGASLEGFLFPDTYNFFPNASAEDIVSKMLVTFDQKFSASMRESVKRQGKTVFDVVRLASVVEGEVNESLDRGIVAGIFQNRLDIDMALQSDATIDYIKGIPEVKHTLDDIAIDSPYNTYLYPGLPVGPINSPSLKSLIAVVNPSETPYFFFLNNATTGETVFAETFEQHIVNKNNNGL